VTALKIIKAQGFVSKAEIVGRSKRIKGKVRRELGKLTNKKTWQLKGIGEEVEGRARERIGRAVRKTRARF
jgi:uncharacterized protein YjbJ (UPF0337 family)